MATSKNFHKAAYDLDTFLMDEMERIQKTVSDRPDAPALTEDEEDNRDFEQMCNEFFFASSFFRRVKDLLEIDDNSKEARQHFGARLQKFLPELCEKLLLYAGEDEIPETIELGLKFWNHQDIPKNAVVSMITTFAKSWGDRLAALKHPELAFRIYEAALNEIGAEPKSWPEEFHQGLADYVRSTATQLLPGYAETGPYGLKKDSKYASQPCPEGMKQRYYSYTSSAVATYNDTVTMLMRFSPNDARDFMQDIYAPFHEALKEKKFGWEIRQADAPDKRGDIIGEELIDDTTNFYTFYSETIDWMSYVTQDDVIAEHIMTYTDDAFDYLLSKKDPELAVKACNDAFVALKARPEDKNIFIDALGSRSVRKLMQAGYGHDAAELMQHMRHALTLLQNEMLVVYDPLQKEGVRQPIATAFSSMCVPFKGPAQPVIVVLFDQNTMMLDPLKKNVGRLADAVIDISVPVSKDTLRGPALHRKDGQVTPLDNQEISFIREQIITVGQYLTDGQMHGAVVKNHLTVCRAGDVGLTYQTIRYPLQSYKNSD